MNTSGREIVIEVVALPPLGHLEREWREMESRSEVSFFTSWSWIGCWLSCLPANIQPKLLRATRNNDVVGLGLLVNRRFRRHRLFPVQGLFLNTTGDASYDTVTIEHNGFLVDQTLQSIIIPRLYEHLAAMTDEWEELYLNGVTGVNSSQLPKLAALRIMRRLRYSYYVNLEEVRAVCGDYLALLGQNTRYNIRRSIKEYAKQGPIALAVAENIDDAFDFFAGLRRLHQAYWQSRGFPGAFNNVFFESFHDRLIRTRFDSGEVQLVRVDVGDQVLGYLYNFIHHGRVHNYQSGFDYAICDKKNRPGLVIHSLAVEYNAAQGHRIYDLLAGDSDYKLALSTNTAEMEWIVYQRDKFKFRVEDGFRQIKHRLRKVVGAQTPD